jgi:hypothetical protein
LVNITVVGEQEKAGFGESERRTGSAAPIRRARRRKAIYLVVAVAPNGVFVSGSIRAAAENSRRKAASSVPVCLVAHKTWRHEHGG